LAARCLLPRPAKLKTTPIWRKEDRADHIYRVAAEIMCQKGYEATSMNDIADAVGLTKAGIYHYIRGKEDLLFEIMSYAMDMVDQDVRVPAQEG
jgi:AcrR family transcriptional regulator